MLDINTPAAELQPVIDTMEDHTEIAPQVITTDMQGRVYEPDHNGSLVPTNRQHKHPALMPPTTDSSTLHDYSLMDRITTGHQKNFGSCEGAHRSWPRAPESMPGRRGPNMGIRCKSGPGNMVRPNEHPQVG
eukprot:SAG31_NODE_5542_length_2467_cov_14.178632_2_plen_132_part_00